MKIPDRLGVVKHLVARLPGLERGANIQHTRWPDRGEFGDQEEVGDVRISKAVITAAGRGARQFPAFDAVQKAMMPVVDRDGVAKPVLQVIAEEAIEAGIEEICVVSAPEDEGYYRRHFESFAASLRSAQGETDDQARRMEEVVGRLRFAVQAEPLGYGHAVWTARGFADGQPVLLLLGDHVYISREPRRCARQLLDLAAGEGCAVSAV